MINFQRATFLLGAAKLDQLPEDSGFEVAFAGRSNAGKSSALNVLTQQKHLARTSKTPGRTQQINVFPIDANYRLIDLPGYGFAKISAKIRHTWEQLLSEYLETRQSLVGLILLMDSRHPLKKTDCMLINWCIAADLPCHVVLTKSDKLNNRDKNIALKYVQCEYGNNSLISVQLFSALKRSGLDKLHHKVLKWMQALGE